MNQSNDFHYDDVKLKNPKISKFSINRNGRFIQTSSTNPSLTNS